MTFLQKARQAGDENEVIREFRESLRQRIGGGNA
jgi:hypothetical protein